MNYKNLSVIYTDEIQFLREKMQYFFDKSFRENDETLLRNLYISLRQLELCENFQCTTEEVELTSLAESLTVACDILASASGISFIFCGDEPCYIKGNRRLISKSLLNLLSNAYLYGKETLVTVKTVNGFKSSRLEVLSGGSFENIAHNGKGLSFVRKASEKMNGKFLIEQGHSHTKAIMIFESVRKFSPITKQDINILDLVNDRLSPACVEMFGMEYH